MDLTVLIADDEADLLVGPYNFPDYLEHAFEHFGVKKDDLEISTAFKRTDALRRILDTSCKLDLVFIDIMWPAVNMDAQDSAKDLLVAALSRNDCVVVALSQEGPVLLSYLFDASKVAYVPHAALLKGHFGQKDIMIGTLATAFSNARKPLMSLKSKFEFLRSDEMSLRTVLSIGEILISELVAIALPGTISAKVKVLAGGLSGAAVMLVDAERYEEGQLVSRSAILKLAQDKNSLLAELEAHAHTGTVPLFPTNLFAGLLVDGVVSFGGWSALAFRAAPGKTAAVARERVLTGRRWGQIFTRELSAAYAGNASVVSIRLGDWAVSQHGLLAGARWSRLCSAAAELGVSAGDRARLRKGGKSFFPNTLHPTALSVVHGDLHTRNVLVAEDDCIFWIDAASIRKLGIWCEDVARFAVWTACGLLDPAEPAAVNSPHLLEALLGITPPAPRSWQENLWRRVNATLSRTAAAIESRRAVKLDRSADWRFVIVCELLRAAYSFEMFAPEIRLAALKAALAVDFSRVEARI